MQSVLMLKILDNALVKRDLPLLMEDVTVVKPLLLSLMLMAKNLASAAIMQQHTLKTERMRPNVTVFQLL